MGDSRGVLEQERAVGNGLNNLYTQPVPHSHAGASVPAAASAQDALLPMSFCSTNRSQPASFFWKAAPNLQQAHHGICTHLCAFTTNLL